MLKGHSPAAMLLLVWLALYTTTPAAAAPPAHHRLRLSASLESVGGLIEFSWRCWTHAALLPLSMWQQSEASPHIRCWYSDFLTALKETWHCGTLGWHWQDDTSEGKEQRGGSERWGGGGPEEGDREGKEMSGCRMRRWRNVLRDTQERIGRECWEISFIWHLKTFSVYTLFSMLARLRHFWPSLAQTLSLDKKKTASDPRLLGLHVLFY